eukprot:XP_017946389.1 PREDICTED: titin homolog [Xenopus tropicalis]
MSKFRKFVKRFRSCFSCFGKRKRDQTDCNIIESVVEEPTEEPKPPFCLEPSVGSGNFVCQEPTETPGNNNCQEEEPEQELEPAINICHETPAFPDNNTCQEEELIVEVSADTRPSRYQESLDESPQLNTSERERDQTDSNIIESVVEEPTEEPKPLFCLEPSVGSGNFVCQELTETPGNNNCQEEEPEQEPEPAINICHETPAFPENNTCQEEDLVVEANADTSPCHYQESVDESRVPQCNTCEETLDIPDDNICQEEELIVEVSADTRPSHYQESLDESPQLNTSERERDQTDSTIIQSVVEEPTEEPKPLFCLEPSVGSGNFVCQEPTETPGNNNCQEEEPEQELEPAINICHETPAFPDNNTCQEEELIVEVSADTRPSHYQESLDESPQLNTSEETLDIPDDNICQEEELIVEVSADTRPSHYQESLDESPQLNTSEETLDIPDDNICQEEELIVEASADTRPCHYQASPEETGTNTSQDEGSVTELSQEDESGVPQCNTCEETPQILDDNICQEEELIVEASADTRPCHYQASPEETGTNTSQDEGSVKELSQEDQKHLKEESGTTTCRPKISQRKRVEPPTNEGNNTISLAEKYPEPGRYFKLGEQIGEDPNGVIYNGWHRSRRMEVAIVIIEDQEKQKGIQSEVQVLEMVSGHENIVDFYGAYYHQAPKTVCKKNIAQQLHRAIAFKLQSVFSFGVAMITDHSNQ